MASRLAVEGFRAVRNRVEVPLSRVTIVTGRNNSGKSSLLEAAAVAFSAFSGLRDAVGRSLLRYIVETKGFGWDLVVSKGKRSATVELETGFGWLRLEMGREPFLDEVKRTVLREAQLLRSSITGVNIEALLLNLGLSPGPRVEYDLAKDLVKFLQNVYDVLAGYVISYGIGRAVGAGSEASSSLCALVALDPEEEAVCTRSIRESVNRLLKIYGVVTEKLIDLYLERTLQLVVKVNVDRHRTLYYFEQSKLYGSVIDEVVSEALAGQSVELAKSLAAVLAGLARVAGLTELGMFLKRLVFLGRAERLARLLLETLLTGYAEALERLGHRMAEELKQVMERLVGGVVRLIFATGRGSWFEDVGKALDTVFASGGGRLLVRLLKPLGVESLWRSSDGRIVVTVDGETVPLEAMGDGFVNMVRLAALHSLVDRGAVVVEEPEASMHPGYLALYAKMLLDYVSGSDRQVLLSTHSIELIDYILAFAEERGMLDDVTVLLLQRYDGSAIEAHTYSGEEAYRLRHEVYEELRGL